MTTPTVSLIIIAYNSGPLLARCLEALAHKDALAASDAAEWIIVDNASADGSVEAARSRYPRVTVIRSETNEGFARAVNRGRAAARGRWLFFINTDAMIHDGVVSALADLLEHEPALGAVGPRLIREDGTIQKSAWPPPSIYSMVFKPLYKFAVSAAEWLYLPGRWYRVPGLRGAFFAVRPRAFDAAGGFDERYFFFLEETDFFCAVRRQGFQIGYLPGVRVTHLSGKGSAAPGFNRAAMYRASLVKFFHKNRPAWESRALALFPGYAEKIGGSR